MGEIKERLMDITTRNFSITKCPEKVYEEFVAFCKEETNDNYSMGLKLLLQQMKANAKEEFIMVELLSVKQRIEALEGKAIEPGTYPTKEEKKGPKTFGNKTSS